MSQGNSNKCAKCLIYKDIRYNYYYYKKWKWWVQQRENELSQVLCCHLNMWYVSYTSINLFKTVSSARPCNNENWLCSYNLKCMIYINMYCPGWRGSPRWTTFSWVPACEPKGHWFDSQSGHMPGLPARSPVGRMRGNHTLVFLSLSFFLFPSKNKHK